MAEQIISKPDVVKKIGVSRATLDRMVAAKTFPVPIKLGVTRVGWRESTVDQWIIDREAEAIGGVA